jgi:glucose/arabinose dehydrogenase
MKNSMLLTPLALALGLGATYISLRSQGTTVQTAPPNAPNLKPAFEGQTRVAERKANVAFDVVTVAEGLQNPWGLSFLPGGRFIVTEKPGRMRIIAADGTLSEPITGLPPVDARGQGGLLDVTLDPEFPSNQLIYWSYAEPQGDGTNNTAVARGKLVTEGAPRVDNVQVIFHQAPSLNSQQHYGNRLVFGRDGTLFVTLGDRSVLPGRVQAQDLAGLIGKIVRINADGTIPKDNPFVGKDGVRPEIWSYGHRNVQGATLHPTTGELWSIEHGPRGGDELNISRKGKDYGWPTITYGIEYNGRPISDSLTAKDGMEQPIYYWDPVIAPGGMTFYTGALFPAWQGSLFIGAMGGKHLVRLTISGERVVGEERLLTDLQPQTERIRDVGEGPDGALYFITDNAKGRLMKIVPGK